MTSVVFLMITFYLYQENPCHRRLVKQLLIIVRFSPGKWRNNIEVAVKTLRQGTMSTQAFLQEAAIMKKFRHDRLVALYAVCSKEEPVYIVTEFMNKGSLLELLRNTDGKHLQFGDLIYIAAQVCDLLTYMHTGFTNTKSSRPV